MKIYIAGPILGVLNYKEKFRTVDNKLKDMGHITINPTFLPDGLSNYMPICKAMIDQAEAVYFMNGWEDSVGSVEEYFYSVREGKTIILRG